MSDIKCRKLADRLAAYSLEPLHGYFSSYTQLYHSNAWSPSLNGMVCVNRYLNLKHKVI